MKYVDQQIEILPLLIPILSDLGDQKKPVISKQRMKKKFTE